MSIKWEVNKWGKERIAPVECIKETAKQVWIERAGFQGRKEVSRRAKEAAFFDTWKEAHDFLLAEARVKLEHGQRQARDAEAALALVKALTEPPAEVGA